MCRSDVAVVDRRVGPIAQQRRGQQRIGPPDLAAIGTVKHRLDIDSEPDSLAHFHVSQCTLFDVQADPCIIDPLNLQRRHLAVLGQFILVRHLNFGQRDFLGQQRQKCRARLGDRLGDDLPERWLVGALVVRVRLQRDLFAGFPFLEHIGAGSDRLGGNPATQGLYGLFRQQ